MMTNLASVRRIHRGLDAVAHLLRRHQFLAGTVAAALGLHLVLDVHAGGAGADQLAQVRAMLKAAPQPVSASTSSGSSSRR